MILESLQHGARQFAQNPSIDGLKTAKIRSLWITCQVIAVWFGVSVVNAQSLSQIRDDVHSVSQPPASQPQEDRKRDHNRYDDYFDPYGRCCDTGNDRWNLLNFLFGRSNNTRQFFAADETRTEFSESNQQDDIDYEIYSGTNQLVSYLAYPYAQGHPGIVLTGSELGKEFQLQTSFWYGTDFDHIDSWNAQLQIDRKSLIGFEMQWAHFVEELSGLPPDRLNIADFNLTGRWIENEVLIVRTGIGLNLLEDQFDTVTGYNLTTSADFFPIKPVIVRFEIDHGEIGSTHQTHLLSTGGVNLKHLECMAGYEYRKIGRTEINGPLLGMRIWW